MRCDICGNPHRTERHYGVDELYGAKARAKLLWGHLEPGVLSADEIGKLALRLKSLAACFAWLEGYELGYERGRGEGYDIGRDAGSGNQKADDFDGFVEQVENFYRNMPEP